MKNTKCKMNKRSKIVLVVLTIVVAMVFTTMIVTKNLNSRIEEERDEYGCFVSEGYSWDDSLGVCLKQRKLDESQKQAVELAIAPLSYPVTIVEVQTLNCLGCFIVKLQRNDNQNIFQMELDNWTYKIKCKEYPYDNCPEKCMVCPSCESCNSVSCQTEESCTSMGFGREWYDAIQKALEDQAVLDKCGWEPGECKNICTSQNYYYVNSSKECKKYSETNPNGGCCTPPPFEKIEECKLICE